MSGQKRKLQVPAELRDILLQFAIGYLLEPPDDVIRFGLVFFARLEEKRKEAATGASIKLGAVTMDKQTVRSVKDETTPAKPVRTKPNPDQSVNNEDKSDRKPAPKTGATRAWLSDALKDMDFYRSMDEQQRGEVVDAMFERSVHANECIIRDGADGDNLYLIASGVFSEYSRGSQEPICTYASKETFGARDLAYSVPKATTVRAQQDGKLWVLERSSYQRILLEATLRRRASYDSLLKAVPMLRTLQDRDRLALVDTLISLTYTKGDPIITQYAEADGMYFIVDGKVSIRLEQEEGEVEISYLQAGDYFGELALVAHWPRVAAAYAATDRVKVAFLDVGAFERLLESCINSSGGNESPLVQICGSFDLFYNKEI
ncbi:AGAP004940-PA-like protein [Anopheles sinensis]|uniref:AGAP004940-PA-like protein n=1 Tax=Anopheles sinensis TaxID=74873 RepID=A0A084WPU3_ANOSI|nr:AGAP004940-PA-like protein [Anopheles sinensis]